MKNFKNIIIILQLILIFVLTLYAIVQKTEADKNLSIAVQAMKENQELKQIAENQRMIAERQKRITAENQLEYEKMKTLNLELQRKLSKCK